MRVTFVDNLIMPAIQDLDLLDVHPHLGLISLAAVATNNGHHVRIYDPKRRVKQRHIPYNENLYKRAAEEILAETPDAVGFTTLGCSFLFVLRVAIHLKQADPALPILLGGPHATMLASEILDEFSCFDIVVRHEAEEILPLVMERLSKREFDMIPGMSWRTPRGVRFTPGSPRIENLDTLPMPSYDHYPVEELNLDVLRVEAGRGCPYECTFCSTAQFFQRRYRLKSADRIVEELDTLNARYGIREFKLDHDLFTVDRRKVLAFCRAVKDRGYRWRVSARVDRVDKELLRCMADAGCVGLYFGVETGSPRLQNVIRKHLDLGLVDPILDQTATLGIEATISVITGYPEELQEDLERSLDIIGQAFMRPPEACIPQFHMLTPEPGTPLFSEFADRLCFDGYPTPFNACLVSAMDWQLVQEHPRLFATYHYYPTQLSRLQHIFAVDAVDLLRQIDRAVLRYTLDQFAGRLSLLIQALWQFAGQETRAARIDPDLVVRYMKTSFGPRHPLTSLFRYSLGYGYSQWGDGRLTSVTTGDSSRTYDRLLPYRLAPWAHIETELHDCQELLTCLRNGSAPAVDAFNDSDQLSSYLIVNSGKATTMWRMDPGLAYILEMFVAPRTVASVIQDIEQIMGAEFPDESIFRTLIEKGILIPPDHAVATNAT